MTDKLFSTYNYENHRNYAAKMTKIKQRNTQAKPRYHDQGTMTEPPYPYVRLNVCRTVAIVAWTIWLLHAMHDQFRGSLSDFLFIPAGVCSVLFFILGTQLPGDIDTDNLFIQSLWAVMGSWIEDLLVTCLDVVMLRRLGLDSCDTTPRQGRHQGAALDE
ncbi:hypothetical protein CCHR01_04742 [Colletotrichum chrysophilum]|uniref:Uncharacterized protein n=1 Tax=Colletotrichum chrysophilum TaxID=1836956 RepID=A0AAD9ELD4_9PEZI|nr:hypothetical protein CCHR01_04742 [Colletotrichum chrysophilum]